MEYKGFTISKETDPWALSYGWLYRFTKGDGAPIHDAESEEDAKEQIDELTANES